MRSVWIKKSGAKRLVVLFGGWGFSENCLNPDAFKDADLLFFHDYRTLEMPSLPDFAPYDKVYLAAWSFGVWVANMFFDRFPKRKISIAINGSWDPVSDTRGIPEDIFRATLNSYDERAKKKFLARIFGSYSRMEELLKYAPHAPADDQKLELAALDRFFKENPQTPKDWTRAIASPADKIFPISSMRNAWGDKLEISGNAHYPAEIFLVDFFKNCEDIFNLRNSFQRASKSYAENAVVQKSIALNLSKMISEVAEKGAERIIELGSGTGFLTKQLLEAFPSARIDAIDLCQSPEDPILKEAGQRICFISADAQSVAFAKNVDIISSASFLQWISNRRQLFCKCKNSLKEGGILAFSTFGPNNLIQIKSLCSSGLEYASLETLKEELQTCGFEILLAKEQNQELLFPTVKDVLKHIKLTGVNGAHKRFWTPRTFERFRREYAARYSAGSGVYLTYNPIYIIAKKG